MRACQKISAVTYKGHNRIFASIWLVDVWYSAVVFLLEWYLMIFHLKRSFLKFYLRKNTEGEGIFFIYSRSLLIKPSCQCLSLYWLLLTLQWWVSQIGLLPNAGKTLPDFLNFHCILHQQALCKKNVKHSQNNGCVKKITCSFQARSL